MCDSTVLCAADVIPVEQEELRIPFASLYSYSDNKDESSFIKIFLPPICIDNGLDLFHMFYLNKSQSFSPYVLNTLVGAANKPAIINAVLSAYESQTGLNRHNLTTQQKLLLKSELDNKNVNSRIQRIVHLNSSDFKDAILGDDSMRMEETVYDEIPEVLPTNGQPAVEYQAAVPEVLDENGDVIQEAQDEVLAQDEIPGTDGIPAVPGYLEFKVRPSVDIHFYSESLSVGVILVVQFIATFRDSDAIPEIIAPPAPFYDAIVSSGSGQVCGSCVSYPREEC